MSSSKMVEVNLWEVMTACKRGRQDVKPESHERAVELVEFVENIYRGFGTELSLRVDGYGTWEISVFSHEDTNDNRITLRITDSGHCTVSRYREGNGVDKTDIVTF